MDRMRDEQIQEDWRRDSRPVQRFGSHRHNNSEDDLLIPRMEESSRQPRRQNSKRFREPSPRVYRASPPLNEEQHSGNDYRDMGWQPHHAYRARGRQRPRELGHDTNVNNWPPKQSPEQTVITRRDQLEDNYNDSHDPYREGDSWFDRYERRNGDDRWSPPRHHTRDTQEEVVKDYRNDHVGGRTLREETAPQWDRSEWPSRNVNHWERPHKSPERMWSTRSETTNVYNDRSWEPSSTWQNARTTSHKNGNHKHSNRKKWSQTTFQREQPP